MNLNITIHSQLFQSYTPAPPVQSFFNWDVSKLATLEMCLELFFSLLPAAETKKNFGHKLGQCSVSVDTNWVSVVSVNVCSLPPLDIKLGDGFLLHLIE